MLWTMCFLPEDSVLSRMGGSDQFLGSFPGLYLASGH